MNPLNMQHPFQNDPGTSQGQRVIDELLAGNSKMDGRTMADLLAYFSDLSRHINFPDNQLNMRDWQPFFADGIPFRLAEIIRFDKAGTLIKFNQYVTLFKNNPDKQSAQLVIHFIYNQLIRQVNTWHLSLYGSGLPVLAVMEKLIQDKLNLPVKRFVCITNLAYQNLGIVRIDFGKLAENKTWNLNAQDIILSDCFSIDTFSGNTELIVNEITNLFSSFLNIIGLVSSTAELSMEQSLFPLKEELQKKHTPHLALLFAFLKLFQHLQKDLNGFTKKHLDFFYQDVLKLKPHEATADKAHVIFEIQKQLDKYLLKKDAELKGGKDNNKEEIYFSLEEDIVVNKAEVAEVKTLFLHQQQMLKSNGETSSIVEGIYIAPNALKADGLIKDFKDESPKNWPTLGNNLSKYSDPESRLIRPYLNARLGFILASPVLLLREGTRKIEVKLACKLESSVCKMQEIDANELFVQVQSEINKTYYYINKDLIAQTVKKGVGKEIVNKLNSFLRTDQKNKCGGLYEKHQFEAVVLKEDFEDCSKNGFTDSQLEILSEIFTPENVLKVSLSGEEEWISPSLISEILITDGKGDSNFVITINVTLQADKPAVSFFDTVRIKENYNTELPVVKIELNEHVKLITNKTTANQDYNFKRNIDSSEKQISLYQFFRNIKLQDFGTKKTKISVTVCGLKNFIVQNDESVMDVNGPIYPFGARPDVIDFDPNNTSKDVTKKGKVGDPDVVGRNLIGPNFYIGSQEVFGKKWDRVDINLNWKDKPSDFREYYKAYWAKKDGTEYGLKVKEFEANLAVLEDGKWKNEIGKENKRINPITGYYNRKLFDSESTGKICTGSKFEQTIQLSQIENKSQFGLNKAFTISNADKKSKYSNESTSGFLKINLQNQDFMHKNYAFVLARQMMAFGRFPDKDLMDGAVYLNSSRPQVFVNKSKQEIIDGIRDHSAKVLNSIQIKLVEEVFEVCSEEISTSPKNELALAILKRCEELMDLFPKESTSDNITILSETLGEPGRKEPDKEVISFISDILTGINVDNAVESELQLRLNNALIAVLDNLEVAPGDIIDPKLFKEVPIPNEPWTPIIQNISLDYKATAEMTDIDLIHLHPFEGTFQGVEIEESPTLFPSFCDEGTLYIGLKNVVPGTNLNILFQLAEATADSESEKGEIIWYYLDNNQWKALRAGFEILDDATEGLTTTGIIKYALPENMTADNIVMSKGLYWIKASAKTNSKAVSEIIGIHPQAVKVTFTDAKGNDQSRLNNPLPAGSIAKLRDADSNLKNIKQPYESFGGRRPEEEGSYYLRVSEQLRHKGRAIQKWDYERLTLEAFPQIFKAKCINHSLALDANKFVNDFPVAPGYVILAVIPDLNVLKAGNSFEPKAPLSLLDDITAFLHKKISPFVRLKVKNPRYEKVNFCLRVSLLKGKDKEFFKEKLGQQLRAFMAPWSVGEYSKLTFGQCIKRSDLIRFLERLDYMDFVTDLKMWHESQTENGNTHKANTCKVDGNEQQICPVTPRSILIAGDIEIFIEDIDCDKWDDENGCHNKPETIDSYSTNMF